MCDRNLVGRWSLIFVSLHGRLGLYIRELFRGEGERGFDRGEVALGYMVRCEVVVGGNSMCCLPGVGLVRLGLVLLQF